jgi:hypothetical protein
MESKKAKPYLHSADAALMRRLKPLVFPPHVAIAGESYKIITGFLKAIRRL